MAELNNDSEITDHNLPHHTIHFNNQQLEMNEAVSNRSRTVSHGLGWDLVLDKSKLMIFMSNRSGLFPLRHRLVRSERRSRSLLLDLKPLHCQVVLGNVAPVQNCSFAVVNLFTFSSAANILALW